jgi:protein O-mannosyl-transferase
MDNRPCPTLPAALLGLLLALAVFVVYGPVTGHGFINYDDPEYAAANPQVQAGLAWSGVQWAFTSTDTGNWIPLTRLSLMLDAALFGHGPAGFHFTNLLLHALNAVLLFLLLLRLTGARWRSALVAALFALHPLHVESVAWIAERKDVLSAGFGLLALLFYIRSARAERLNRKSQIVNYLLALFLFACSLLAKPMLVTLPFVLLLLDFWPLERVAGFRVPGSGVPAAQGGLDTGNMWQLFREKIPFLLLSVAVSVIAIRAQKAHGALAPLAELPLAARLGHVFPADAAYLAKTFWPADLAVFYPLTGPAGGLRLAGAVLLVLGGSALAVWRMRRQPYLFAGWFWFLGTLVPVIGLVQVGVQSMADRYTYVPLTGLFIMVVWGGAEWCARLALPRFVPAAVAAGVLAACAVRTAGQLEYWKDSETLFRHALAVTKDNYIAYLNLGLAQFDAGHPDEAIASYGRSLAINPDFGNTHNCLGVALAARHRLDEAAEHFNAALRTMPEPWKAHSNLGNVRLEQRRFPEAVAEYQLALQLCPGNIDALHNLGRAFALQGRNAEARKQFEAAIRLEPGYGPEYFQLGLVLAGQGDTAGAIREWQAALDLAPDWASPLNSLAWALATGKDPAVRDPVRAVRLAEHAASVTRFKSPEVLDTLGTAYAAAGQFPRAILFAQQALARVPADGKMAAEIRARLESYRAGKAWSE